MFFDTLLSSSKAVTIGSLSVIALFGISIQNACAAPETSFSYTSQAGDFVGQGKSGTYTAPGSIIHVTGQGTSEFINVSVYSQNVYWHIFLAAPRGEKFRPQVYYNAERATSRTGRAPGLEVSTSGRGCNETWGTIAVNQVTYDATGKLTSLDLNFSQRCELSNAPVLNGTVKYNALPLKAVLVSERGDYIGQGVNRTFLNSSSTFTLTGKPTALQYSVSGNRSYFDIVITAPTGKTLVPGTYTTSARGDAKNAGLEVSGNGRGCTSTGTLTIKSIRTNTSGNVTGLNATFVNRCPGSNAALRGAINHFE